jgi:hypothetical protein
VTESTPEPEPRRSQNKSKSDGAAWKSGLLVVGISAVVFGAALLIKETTPSEAQSEALVSAGRGISAPTTQLDQEPSNAPVFRSGNARNQRLRLQQPGFQRPLTRSRGS